MKYIFFLVLSLMTANLVGQGYKVGDVAQDFSLLNVDGKKVSLADYKEAKGFVITFTCNHCPYAVFYEDRLIELNNKYAPLGYPVVAIMPNDPEVKPADSYNNMKLRADEKGFTFPYLYDEGQKIYPIYGATKTPHVYLLDRDRVVQYIGAIDDSPKDEAEVEETFLADAIEALIAGKKPDPATTKAIGCSIKTKS